MQRNGFRVAMIALVCALEVGSGSVGAAAAATPDGYQRVSVEGVPVSVAVPDDWQIRPITRAGAKKILKENPQLVAQGATIESLLATPLTTGWDADGDSYLDRYLTVQLIDVTGLPSPNELETQFNTVAGLKVATVKRATVAKKPALVATYTQVGSRDDGAPLKVFGTTYVFVPRPGHGVLLQFFDTSESDADFVAIADTMIKSVKVR